MKITTTLFLALVLTGLGFYYQRGQVGNSNLSPGGVSSALGPAKILAVAPGDSLVRLEIQVFGDGSGRDRSGTRPVPPRTVPPLAIKREKEGWRLESPVSYPAENFMVEGMVNALTFSDRLRRLPAHGKPWSELGLDRPAVRVKIKTEKGGAPRSLLLGKHSPVLRALYARWEDESEYFLVAPEIPSVFDRTAYSLRQKRLFRPENVSGEPAWLHVKVGARFPRPQGGETPPLQFRIERRGKRWFWLLPKAAGEIPVEKVWDLIYSLQSLYVKEFLDGEDPKKPEWGFRPTDSFLAAGGEGGTGEKIFIGVPAEGKDARYGLRENERLVLLISESHLKSILENFELVFQEAQDERADKAQNDSGKNQTDDPGSGAGPGGREARAGDQNGPRSAHSGGL